MIQYSYMEGGTLKIATTALRISQFINKLLVFLSFTRRGMASASRLASSTTLPQPTLQSCAYLLRQLGEMALASVNDSAFFST